MALFTKIGQKLQTIAYLVENPRLFLLRAKGCNIATVRALNQPWFLDLDFKTVIDIGAHVGKFSLIIRELLPEAAIFAFEPIPDCFNTLIKEMKDVDTFTGFNLALSDSQNTLSFQHCSFTAASSFLQITPRHQKLIEFSSDMETISISVERLDNLIDKLNIIEPLLIKIDVQGFEDKVLNGGLEVIKTAKLIIIETSFQTLYVEQPLFNDIYKILSSLGFTYIGSLDQWADPQTGEYLQSDSLFLRKA